MAEKGQESQHPLGTTNSKSKLQSHKTGPWMSKSLALHQDDGWVNKTTVSPFGLAGSRTTRTRDVI